MMSSLTSNYHNMIDNENGEADANIADAYFKFEDNQEENQNQLTKHQQKLNEMSNYEKNLMLAEMIPAEIDNFDFPSVYTEEINKRQDIETFDFKSTISDNSHQSRGSDDSPLKRRKKFDLEDDIRNSSFYIQNPKLDNSTISFKKTKNPKQANFPKNIISGTMTPSNLGTGRNSEYQSMLEISHQSSSRNINSKKSRASHKSKSGSRASVGPEDYDNHSDSCSWYSNAAGDSDLFDLAEFDK